MCCLTTPFITVALVILTRLPGSILPGDVSRVRFEFTDMMSRFAVGFAMLFSLPYRVHYRGRRCHWAMALEMKAVLFEGFPNRFVLDICSLPVLSTYNTRDIHTELYIYMSKCR